MSGRSDYLIPILSAAIGAALGATATIATGAFGYFNRDRELDIRLVDVGLAILKAEQIDSAEDRQTSEPARRFALRLLQKYSDVDIPIIEFDAWAGGGPLRTEPLPYWTPQSEVRIRDHRLPREPRGPEDGTTTESE